MVCGKRKQQRVGFMQQAALVWSPIGNEWDAMQFIQRGQMPAAIPDRVPLTPEVVAKMKEIQETGRVIFDKPREVA